MWSVFVLLTRKPAVVVGVTVVSIKLCGDSGGVTEQQEDEAHSSHLDPRETFAQAHLQRINRIPQLHVKQTNKKTLMFKLDVEKQTQRPS